MEKSILRKTVNIYYKLLFVFRVEEAYKRIQNPACIIVDASPSSQEVLQQVQHLIRNKCHL
uniref:Uncharacterized protein n=1 Tax=Cyprinus carpio carpio TaxID=630221 RepID=A0A9J8ALG1_CYPCA